MMSSICFPNRRVQRWALFLLIVVLDTIPSPAQRPLGIDVSDYQGNINWTNVKKSGIEFAWTKATEGVSATESTFTANMANARNVGIPIGAYHYAHPETHLGLAGADQEAAAFWNTAGSYIINGGNYLMPVLDIEADLSPASPAYTKATLSAWVNQWCSNIVSRAASNGVVVKPIVYSYVFYATTWLDTSVTNWTLWMAQYPASPNPLTGNPSGTSPWASSAWQFWQYSSTGSTPGAFGNCDLDVFNGTLTGLTNFVIGARTNPPSFISQPSSRYVDRGGTITFRTTAMGTHPLKYQWRFNGTNIANATNNSYTLANIQTTNAGSYTVVVTNNFGNITGSIASLTVNPLFVPIFSDNFDTNSAANWTLNRSSTDSRATFTYDYSGFGIPSAPNSSGGTTKGLRLEANVSLTNVSALSLSPIGQSFTGNYRLHYDLWMNANGPFPAGGTGSTQHHTSGLGTTGTNIQWNSAADGVWFATDGEGQSTDTSATLPDWRAYIGTTLQSAASGVYVGGTESNIRGNGHPYYSNVFPGGQPMPATQSQSGWLEAGTIGFAWRDVVVNKTGNTIDWFIDGLKICSITSVLPSTNISIGYWDSFSSLSANTNLAFGLVDNVRVEIPAVAPAISIQPLAVAVKVTSNATFNVTATGTPAPTYQWRFNGTNIAAATIASYTRTNVQYSQAGNYSVLVSNLAGTVISSNALLTILPAAPAEFQTYAIQPDSSMILDLNGDVGATYFVESSTNLVDWSVLTNVSLTSPTIQFSIGTTTNDPQRYFRARSAP